MNATEDLSWLDSPSSLTPTLARLRTVQALGLDAGIDFHGRLHKPMAKQLTALLEPLRPLFIEEPLLSEHIDGIAQIAAQTSIPIALGERLYSRWDVKPFLKRGCVDVIQPDVAHVGGISERRRIASMAEVYDVALAPHCPLGPVALAACMQVDAASSNFTIQEMSLGIHYNTGGVDLGTYVKDEGVFRVEEGGYVKVLEGVGLGIEVDEAKVREMSRGAEAWVSPGFVGPGGEWREW